MANIVLITVVLAVFCSMATAASVKEMMGDSLCEYKSTPEDCEQLDRCLKKTNYTVENACDNDEVVAANISMEDWYKIYNCTWRESGQIKDDFIAAAEKCNKDNEKDCTAAQICASLKFWKMCYPNAEIPEQYDTDA